MQLLKFYVARNNL